MFVYVYEVVSTSCQPSCTSKHSYMHNHASYMLMHLLKLLHYSYTLHFRFLWWSLSKSIMSISSFYCHANFKIQQSCQLQTSAVLSNSSSCSYVSQIQFIFKYDLFLLTAKWPVRIQEQLVPVNSFLLSVKWLLRIQEQLVPANLLSFLLSVKWLVRIQEQLVPANLLSFLL